MENETQIHTSFEAEQIFLGALLINGELMEHVEEFLIPEHFYETLHQKIYSALKTLFDRQIASSPITVKSMLEKDETFIQSNGSTYLSTLVVKGSVVVSPIGYAKVIYEMAMKRNLIIIAKDILDVANNSTLELTALEQLEQAELKMFELASSGLSGKSFTPISNCLKESMSQIDRALKSSSDVTGISTGFADLDSKLSGFQNSDLVILAGRPSMGKTAFAINFAYNACKALMKKTLKDQKPPCVGFFSLEMSSDQLSTRLLSMVTKIDSTKLRNGKVGEEHYNDLKKAATQLSDVPLFIDDTPALSIAALRSRARKLKRKHNLGIIFVDYLQLVRGSKKADNRVVEISEITQGLKAIAKELSVPVIALSQLSRAVESREDKRPTLSDLRESGSIEQDADIVMFLYREEYYLQRSQPKAGDAKYPDWVEKRDRAHNIAEIIIAKHRNGSIGSVPLSYVPMYSSIINLDIESIKRYKGN